MTEDLKRIPGGTIIAEVGSSLTGIDFKNTPVTFKCDPTKKTYLLIGLIGGAVIFIVLVIIALIIWWRCRKNKKQEKKKDVKIAYIITVPGT